MGCGCKKSKGGNLNNLKSKDHLKLAYDFVKDVLQDKEWSELDQLQQMEARMVFNSIYPNSSIKDDLSLIVSEIKFAAEKYK